MFWRRTPKSTARADKPVIVQFWNSSPAPKEVETLMQTWRSAEAEGFEYLGFDDGSALEFIRRHYGERVEKAYLACDVAAMRSDLIRICALLIHPGVYIDADMRRTGLGLPRQVRDEACVPFRPFVERLGRGLLFRRENRIANGFMVIRRPQDPLLRKVLDTAVENVERRISNNVYLVTGPGILTKLREQLGESHDLFAGFEFWVEDQLKPYMAMMGSGDLPYKKTDDHWVHAQKKRSIFAEKPAGLIS